MAPVLQVLPAIALVLAIGGSSVTPRELLLDLEARKAYVAEHRSSLVLVRFKERPIGRRAARFQPDLTTNGVLVGKPGHLRVLAPDHRLRHADGIRLVFDGGEEVPVTARFGEDKLETPLVELTLSHPLGEESQKKLERYEPLRWAPDESVEDGRRGWVLELPLWRSRRGRVSPVLVDTALGDKVEYPLERLRYIQLKDADGVGVLDVEGRLLCVVFRAVPGTASSLCAPRQAALEPLGRFVATKP